MSKGVVILILMLQALDAATAAFWASNLGWLAFLTMGALGFVLMSYDVARAEFND